MWFRRHNSQTVLKTQYNCLQSSRKMLQSLLVLHHCDKELLLFKLHKSMLCSAENDRKPNKHWKVKGRVGYSGLESPPFGSRKGQSCSQMPITKDGSTLCVLPALCRRVGGWVERMDSGKGETERKCGVKYSLSMTAGIFGRYSDGCWTSNFPRTLYQYTQMTFSMFASPHSQRVREKGWKAARSNLTAFGTWNSLGL